MNIVLLEDDAITRLALSNYLQRYGQVTSFSYVKEFEESISQNSEDSIDLLILDLDLESPLSGFDLLEKYQSKFAYKVILTGHEEKNIIRLGYSMGANDYLIKPYNTQDIQSLMTRVRLNAIDLKEKISRELNLSNSKNIQKYEEKIMQVASSSSLLLTGETGTGKTSFAKFIKDELFEGPFVHINCAEIPETLIESELFGYRRGAFTGADKDYEGKIKMADGGVLFLDEITALSVKLQRKLLSAIEEKSFYPVGSKQRVRSNFYIISATCDDIVEMMNQGQFRDDLYYRLSSVSIDLLPLHKRKTDIPSLVESFLKEGRAVLLDDESIEVLKEHSWPGNIRELKNVISLLKSTASGLVHSSAVRRILNLQDNVINNENFDLNHEEVLDIGLPDFLKKLEKIVLNETLERNDQQVRKTLRDLKISQSAYYRILKSQ